MNSEKITVHFPFFTSTWKWKMKMDIDFSFLPRDAAQSAVLHTANCPSVRNVEVSTYRDHVGWNSSKIISWLVSLGCSLSTDPNTTDLLQGEHPDILCQIGEGYGKSRFLISLKRDEIALRLLLTTNRKSYTCIRLVPKSTTLVDREGWFCTLLQIHASFGAHHENLNYDSSFWQYKAYVDICRGFLDSGRQRAVG